MIVYLAISCDQGCFVSIKKTLLIPHLLVIVIFKRKLANYRRKTNMK